MKTEISIKVITKWEADPHQAKWNSIFQRMCIQVTRLDSQNT